MKKFLSKLDRISLILVAVSLVGIAASLYFLYRTGDRGSYIRENSIAKVSFFQNDTRLKRSDEFVWYRINQVVEGYADDRLFTGADSYATIEYPSGAKVTVQPNSIISLSSGYLSLSAGSIEIDTEKGALSIESFGEVFEVRTPGKTKVINTKETKRIIPPANSTAESKSPFLKKYLAPPALVLTSPAQGEPYPQLKNLPIVFKWRLPNAAVPSKFKVDFSQDESFSSIALSQETTNSELFFPVERFSSGKWFWRVSALPSGSTARSLFFVKEARPIRLLSPVAKSTYSLKDATQGLLFSWEAPLDLNKVLQLSRSSQFSEPLAFEVSGGNRTVPLTEPAEYHWRVGYRIPGGSTHWDQASTFTVIPEKVLSPISIADVPRSWDFSLNKSYTLEVVDPNRVKSYLFEIFRNEKLVLKKQSNKEKVKISKLDDGQYQIKVTALLPKEEKISSPLYTFTVNNSKPVKAPELKAPELKAPELKAPDLNAPKIKNRQKVKIFVKVFRKVLDLLLPSAHADPGPEKFYRLEWVGQPGQNYEIEIINDQGNRVVLERTESNEYRFVVPRPGTYSWRVRAVAGDQKGPFSMYSSIEVIDKITQLEKPLMIAPEDGSILELKSKQRAITFRWKEPEPNFTYYLELFRKPTDKNPARVYKVKGGSVQLKFSRVPKQLYWRVTAESEYKNRSGPKETFVVKIDDAPPLEVEAGIEALYTQFSIKQSFKNAIPVSEELSLSGPTAHLWGEYYFRSSQNDRSVRLDGSYSSLTSSEAEAIRRMLMVRHGWRNSIEKNSSHTYYLGFRNDAIDVTEKTGSQAFYQLNFITGSYRYIRELNEKLQFEMMTGVLVPVQLDVTPSLHLHPALHYRLNKEFLLRSSFGYERIFSTGQVDYGGESSDVEFSLQKLSLGFGLIWRP